jgi:DNA recombination protein RmuC
MDWMTVLLLAGLALAILLLLWIGLRPAPAGPGEELAQISERVTAVKADVERLDRVLREDREAERSAADERARLLRQEILGAIGELRTELAQTLGALGKDQREASALLREEMLRSLMQTGEGLRTGAKDSSEAQRLELEKMVAGVDRLSRANTEALEKLRDTLSTHLTTLRNENSEKLELMRKTVDEQLQGTLEKRLGESFKQVSERLEQVHRGLGEMQNLATGVGDLKRVLSNVKVRGTWGETQLANLLAQVFSPEQYKTNVSTKPGSAERVEFAIRLPGRGPEDAEVLLPIDAKFPREDYERLVEAAEAGDADAVDLAGKALEARIRNAAKDIRDKYIHPPETTDFAILFLPTEGLYAELLRRPGLADQLQSEFRVALAGPTTLNALLNSLQMGFRTLAIQRRSSEVWELLGAVKTEFEKYGGVLDRVQKKLQEASRTVDDVAVRHRAVARRLRRVSEVPETQAMALLGLDDDGGPTSEEEGPPRVNRAGGA